jgi:hypothetical protein
MPVCSNAVQYSIYVMLAYMMQFVMHSTHAQEAKKGDDVCMYVQREDLVCIHCVARTLRTHHLYGEQSGKAWLVQRFL